MVQPPTCPAACAVATLACVMINLLPRRDLAEAGDSGEEGAEVRPARSRRRLGLPAAAAAAAASARAARAGSSRSIQHPPLPPPAQFRARLWLFLSFLIAAGAVAGSVAVLVSASGQAGLAGLGVVSGPDWACGLLGLCCWLGRSGRGRRRGLEDCPRPDPLPGLPPALAVRAGQRAAVRPHTGVQHTLLGLPLGGWRLILRLLLALTVLANAC